MSRLFLALNLIVLSMTNAQAGIDEVINNATAPIAELIGKIVFFKIPIGDANLPVCRFYGWSLVRYFLLFIWALLICVVLNMP